jgi:hypothetical protein
MGASKNLDSVRPAMSRWPGFARHMARHGAAPGRKSRETFMQYMLLIYSVEGGWNAMPEEQQKAGLAAYMAYGEALRKAGVYVQSDRLRDTPDATTVTIVNGKTQVMDGPFADTKEALGGYYLIDVKNLDEAISWAARCPGASHGKVEVRPVWAMS